MKQEAPSSIRWSSSLNKYMVIVEMITDHRIVLIGQDADSLQLKKSIQEFYNKCNWKITKHDKHRLLLLFLQILSQSNKSNMRNIYPHIEELYTEGESERILYTLFQEVVTNKIYDEAFVLEVNNIVKKAIENNVTFYNIKVFNDVFISKLEEVIPNYTSNFQKGLFFILLATELLEHNIFYCPKKTCYRVIDHLKTISPSVLLNTSSCDLRFIIEVLSSLLEKMMQQNIDITSCISLGQSADSLFSNVIIILAAGKLNPNIITKGYEYLQNIKEKMSSDDPNYTSLLLLVETLGQVDNTNNIDVDFLLGFVEECFSRMQNIVFNNLQQLLHSRDNFVASVVFLVYSLVRNQTLKQRLYQLWYKMFRSNNKAAIYTMSYCLLGEDSIQAIKFIFDCIKQQEPEPEIVNKIISFIIDCILTFNTSRDKSKVYRDGFVANWTDIVSIVEQYKEHISCEIIMNIMQTIRGTFYMNCNVDCVYLPQAEETIPKLFAIIVDKFVSKIKDSSADPILLIFEMCYYLMGFFTCGLLDGKGTWQERCICILSNRIMDTGLNAPNVVNILMENIRHYRDLVASSDKFLATDFGLSDRIKDCIYRDNCVKYGN